MTDARPTKLLKDIAGIVRDWMNLEEEQVVLGFQKYDIPPTGALLVVISIQDTTVIGSNVENTPNENPSGMIETMVATLRDMIQIDVLAMTTVKDGRNFARERKNEVLMCLRSQLSEQVQTNGSFQLARVPTGFVNTSSLEGTQYLERYTATLAVTYQEEHENVPKYFDKGFNVKVNEDPEFSVEEGPFAVTAES